MVEMFQSTRPRGARHRDELVAADAECGFNPRAREGRDERELTRKDKRELFQSTRPRGARPRS